MSLDYFKTFDSLLGSKQGRIKVYLAGPMTGYPRFNFPFFDRVADELRAMGNLFEVVSPAELDDPAAREAALQSEWGDPAEYAKLTGMTWADFLSRDVKLISDGGFDAILCLPGWENSRGARLETFVGYLNGLRLFQYKINARREGGHVEPLVTIDLASAWVGPDADI